MSNKNANKKIKRPKKIITQGVIADVVGCSISSVKKVISGDRSADTDLGTRIELADGLLEEGVNNVIENVKKIVRK